MVRKKDIAMYWTHNEGKSVAAEWFIKTLKNKIYKYKTQVSKNVHIDKLDDAVNKYNNTYQSTIKVKPVFVKSSTYSDSSKEINDKNPKFKIGDSVRISKYIYIFAKGYNTNLSEKVFMIEKVKNMLHICEHVINDINGEEIVWTFYENKLQKNK